MPEIHNKDGSLSSYAFDCGYQELEDSGEIRTRLYKEHGVYHVRCHDHKNQVRLVWETFGYLKPARRYYNFLRKQVRNGA